MQNYIFVQNIFAQKKVIARLIITKFYKFARATLIRREA